MRVVPDDLIQLTVWSPEANGVVRVLKRLLRTTPLGMRFFEPKKREWVAPALRRLNRLDLGRYDIVLTCSQPHTNHLMGLRHQEAHRAPLDRLLRRSVVAEPVCALRQPTGRRLPPVAGDEVLATADRVLFTSDEMLRLAEEDHAAALQGKAGVLPHSFVPQWFGSPQTPKRGAGPMRVLHTGHFYGPRSPAPLCGRSAGCISAEISSEISRSTAMAASPIADREELARNGLDQVVRVHPVIPYLDSLELMRQHDLLLLVDAKLTQTAESVFLPSKLVDYLGSGTPVMAVTPVPGTTARASRRRVVSCATSRRKMRSRTPWCDSSRLGTCLARSPPPSNRTTSCGSRGDCSPS